MKERTSAHYLIFGLLTTTFAQSGRQDRRIDNTKDVVLGPSERTGYRYEQMNDPIDDHPSFDSRSKERQLQRIRDEYDHKSRLCTGIGAYRIQREPEVLKC